MVIVMSDFMTWFENEIKGKLSYATMAFQNNKADLEAAFNAGKASVQPEIPFQTDDVYQLIDAVELGGVELEEWDNHQNSYSCNFCSANIDEFHGGKRLEMSDAEKLLEHDAKCPYTLSISMNTGRDYDKYPLNDG